MNEDVAFIKEYQSKGALFDANLLLVYVVGKCGKSKLRQCHHTKQYVDEFPLIVKLVESFAVPIVLCCI